MLLSFDDNKHSLTSTDTPEKSSWLPLSFRNGDGNIFGEQMVGSMFLKIGQVIFLKEKWIMVSEAA